MLNFLLGALLGVVLSLVVVAAIQVRREVPVTWHELELQIREGITERIPFWIQNTNLHITPRADGSGIIKIKERR